MCRPAAVVPVRSSRSILLVSRSHSSASCSRPARANRAGVDPRRERAAVRGSRLVEEEVRLERAVRDLVGHEVVQHQTSACFDDLGTP